MDDGKYDICETILGRDSVQRLLYILRQTQACTEHECYPISRLPGPQNPQPSGELFFVTMILGLMALLYVFRPSSLRQRSHEEAKNRDNVSGSNGDPPAPPPSSN